MKNLLNSKIKVIAIAVTSILFLYVFYSFVIMTKETKKTFEMLEQVVYEFNYPETVTLKSANYGENQYGSLVVCLISAENAFNQRRYDYYIIHDDGTISDLESQYDLAQDLWKELAHDSNVNELAINLRLKLMFLF